MASQDQSWFKPLFHLEKRGLKKIHQIKHMCCLFDRREYSCQPQLGKALNDIKDYTHFRIQGMLYKGRLVGILGKIRDVTG